MKGVSFLVARISSRKTVKGDTMKTQGWKAPECSSGKASYRTAGDARRALRAILIGQLQAVAPTATPPKREYRCPECHVWHLTKSEDRSMQHA